MVAARRVSFGRNRRGQVLNGHSYWGQNSRGAVDGTDTANFQKDISYYCNVSFLIVAAPCSTFGLTVLQDDNINVLPVSFVNVFFGTGGAPEMNLANSCNNVDNATFPGTKLPNCAALADDIQYCQSKGKLVTLR